MRSRKRILCLIDTLGPGGAQRQIVGLAHYLKEIGYCVKVSVYYDNQFYIEQLRNAGIEYDYIPKVQKGLLRQWHLMRYIRKEHPEVVISYLESPSIRACVAHLFNPSFKLIVSERNTTQKTGWVEKLRFNIFRFAEYVVPNAFAQECYINKTFPFLSSKTVTIPNFVDLQHFKPPVERIRRNTPEIMIAATIWASKNTLGLIDAVALLKGKEYKFHVSWYGKDEMHLGYYNQCQQKIEQLGVEDCIDLKEKTTAIRDKYQEADYFCLPSFYEGTPNVICEAMACGLPIACSDVCDNSRYVKQGVNGFLFNPKDAESMADALEKLLMLNGNDYKSYCRCSRKRAEDMLSKEIFVQSYIKLIEQ